MKRHAQFAKMAAELNPGDRIATKTGRVGPARFGVVIEPSETLLAQHHDDRDVPIRWVNGRETWIEVRHIRRIDVR